MDGVCRGAESTLRAHLGEMAGCWLHIRCGSCPVSTAYPIRLLIDAKGLAHQLGAIVARLVCKRCRAAPAQITVADLPNFSASKGAQPGWSVKLIDRPAMAVELAQADACLPAGAVFSAVDPTPAAGRVPA